MPVFRRFIAQRHFAALICAAALCLKLWMPSGYMIGNAQGHITIILCSGVASQPMEMAMPGMRGDMPGHDGKEHGKTEMPCAFSGLSAPALGAVDPILLVAFIAFVMAMGLCPALLPAPLRRTYLRPPLRGPPVLL